MFPITTQVVAELDVLYGLYQLALDCTQKLREEPSEKLMKWIDTRQRILGRAAGTADAAGRLIKVFSTTRNVPVNEQALVTEKKQMIKDMVTKMQVIEADVMRNIGTQMLTIRKDLANTTRKTNAAKAYNRSQRPVAVLR